MENDHALEIDTLTQEILTEKGLAGTLEEWKSKINIHEQIDN